MWTGGPRSWRSISAVEHCLSNCKPLKQAPSKSWPWWLSSVCAANGFVPFHALEISTYASARQADCFFLQTHQPTGVNQPTGRCTTAFLGHFRSNTLARTTAVVAPCCTSETPRAPHRWPGKPGPSLNGGKRSLAIGQLSSKASQLRLRGPVTGGGCFTPSPNPPTLAHQATQPGSGTAQVSLRSSQKPERAKKIRGGACNDALPLPLNHGKEPGGRKEGEAGKMLDYFAQFCHGENRDGVCLSFLSLLCCCCVRNLVRNKRRG